MGKVIWSPSAEADLNDIEEFVSLDSIRYARRLVIRLFDRTQVLRKLPLMGRHVPELSEHENVRELIESNYRILYEVRIEQVFILRVLHSSRDFPKAFQ